MCPAWCPVSGAGAPVGPSVVRTRRPLGAVSPQLLLVSWSLRPSPEVRGSNGKPVDEGFWAHRWSRELMACVFPDQRKGDTTKVKALAKR